MNDELNRATVILDIEKEQREALVLPDPVPAENTTSTSIQLS